MFILIGLWPSVLQRRCRFIKNLLNRVLKSGPLIRNEMVCIPGIFALVNFSSKEVTRIIQPVVHIIVRRKGFLRFYDHT